MMASPAKQARVFTRKHAIFLPHFFKMHFSLS
jgi:hypothetical protein